MWKSSAAQNWKSYAHLLHANLGVLSLTESTGHQFPPKKLLCEPFSVINAPESWVILCHVSCYDPFSDLCAFSPSLLH